LIFRHFWNLSKFVHTLTEISKPPTLCGSPVAPFPLGSHPFVPCFLCNIFLLPVSRVSLLLSHTGEYGQPHGIGFHLTPSHIFGPYFPLRVTREAFLFGFGPDPRANFVSASARPTFTRSVGSWYTALRHFHHGVHCARELAVAALLRCSPSGLYPVSLIAEVLEAYDGRPISCTHCCARYWKPQCSAQFVPRD